MFVKGDFGFFGLSVLVLSNSPGRKRMGSLEVNPEVVTHQESSKSALYELPGVFEAVSECVWLSLVPQLFKLALEIRSDVGKFFGRRSLTWFSSIS